LFVEERHFNCFVFLLNPARHLVSQQEVRVHLVYLLLKELDPTAEFLLHALRLNDLLVEVGAF
jgi:hypothetical protein